MNPTSRRRAVWGRLIAAVACGVVAVLVVGSVWRCPPRPLVANGQLYESSRYVVSVLVRPSVQCAPALPWPDAWWAPWVLVIGTAIVIYALLLVAGMMLSGQREGDPVRR